MNLLGESGNPIDVGDHVGVRMSPEGQQALSTVRVSAKVLGMHEDEDGRTWVEVTPLQGVGSVSVDPNGIYRLPTPRKGGNQPKESADARS